MPKFLITLFVFATLFLKPSYADVVATGPDGFHLKLERSSELESDALFDRVKSLSSWWNSDHTYSGSAENLHLTGLYPGAKWIESWDGGLVEHGEVIAVFRSETGQTVRFAAALGPLQEIGVSAVLSIEVRTAEAAEDESGSRVVFNYHVTGADHQKLDQWAPIVDQVLSQQIDGLAGVTTGTKP